jgi:putative tryptophan/tyrosine transport system substrate-binding protein
MSLTRLAAASSPVWRGRAATFEFSMAGKWLQTLKQVAPRVKRVAIIFNPQTAPFSESFVWVAEAAAPAFAAEIVSAGVHDNAELETW